MVLQGEAKEAVIDEECVLRIKGRVCVPHVDDLIHIILTKAYSSRYSIHPGATKMYRDLRQHNWWSRMKRNIVDFVAQCPNFQQTLGKFDSIWVIVERLTVSSHFIPVKMNNNAEKLAKLYVSEIVR
ncbi:uncharacterized protein [Solanum lycopersicum]|uniref:uncharacterized protein n=1 Tax=Solanum lycopersicum TaxID=4081 RepID=UPI0037490732